MRSLSMFVACSVLCAAPVAGQGTAAWRDTFVVASNPVLALTHVLLLDGTGGAPKADQTVIIRDGKIAAVGPAASTAVPAGARTMDLTGHTLVPGFIGMHDHLFYTAAGGRRAQLLVSGPRLYLASGVTTIRTTGSSAPYADINTKDVIDRGRAPGPRIHITAPYITGAGGGGFMAELTTPEQARRFVAYWAGEGATWIKAYTNIRRSELGAAIQEAHARGMKVTGHLCSVSYQEAVALGIDNLEHGLFTASDFVAGKSPDQCPSNITAAVGNAADISGDVAKATIRAMVQKGVSMTSTMAVYEPMFQNRPTKDQRTLDAMAPEVREAYLEQRNAIDNRANPALTDAMLKKAMAFDRAFFEAGGLLAAGVDPTGFGGALPGFGDQRNFEMFIEAGFTAPQAVQIMTANGARILGLQETLGTVAVGKTADLVVMRGDLSQNPATVRNVTVVFKDGVGYDSPKLIASVAGKVGIN